MLEKYREKRNFDATPEPGPKVAESGEHPLTFVIQKHDARRLHYDFRLELDGVLISWAVPKGPSLDPKVKRLAVKVEDHPLAYATFEGTIPEGNYGAGKVIVWDEGTYTTDHGGTTRAEMEAVMREDLKKGKLAITMFGTKMHGSWTFVKTHGREEDSWLLMKHEDEFASDTRDILEDADSVRSKFSLDIPPTPKKLPPSVEKAPGGPIPKAMTPMMSVEKNEAFDAEGWTFEVKLDGIRTLATLDRGIVTLVTRNQNDITAQYPEVATAIRALPYRSIVLDGEIVLFDEHGRPTFQGLMERFHLKNTGGIEDLAKRNPVQFFAFDVLHLDGRDLRTLALEDRQKALSEIDLDGGIKRVDSIPTEGKLLYEHAVELGFEGVMAKKLSSKYEAGVRSPNWVKIKSVKTGEFTIVGYTPGEGSRRSAFGSLVMAQQEEGEWVYKGNVGGGFNDQMLDDVKAQLDALKTDKKAIKDRSVVPKNVTWLEPKLIAEVKYANKTRDGRLRFPVFLRFREDLMPTPATVKAASAPAKPPEGVDEIERVLEQLNSGKKDVTLEVGGYSLKVTNLDRPVWPGEGDHPPGTKRDHLIYLAKTSSFIMPHLKNRPVTLTRYPEGAGGTMFFQKHVEKAPEFVKRVNVYSRHNKEARDLILCDNLVTLLWFGQMASIELHPWYSRIVTEPDAHDKGTDFWSNEEAIDASVLNYPDFMVVDLDPYKYAGTEKEGEEPAYNKEAFHDACEVALKTKEMLDGIGAVCLIKTSGKTGLHLFVPIIRTFEYDDVRVMAETIGLHVQSTMPERVTLEWKVTKRVGKVFFDYNQNSRGKTLASAYSPRPSAAATVSFPVPWTNLAQVDPLDYTVHTAPDLLAKHGDLWANILNEKRPLGGA